MPTTYNILILGASYGSLLGTKLALAGHTVHLVCLPAEADLINREGAIVRLPVKGRDGLVEINSQKLPGKLSAGGTTAFKPADYDLVALAMQEPQYRSPGVRELLEAVARARVPCMSIMNMPPLPYLKRLPGLNAEACRSCYTDPTVWDSFDPALMTLCSPDPQAFRPPEDKVNVLQVGCRPTSRRPGSMPSAHRHPAPAGGGDRSGSVRRGRWPRSPCPSSSRCTTPSSCRWRSGACCSPATIGACSKDGMRSIKDAVHSDIEASRAVYNWVVTLCMSLGAAEQTSCRLKNTPRRRCRSSTRPLRRGPWLPERPISSGWTGWCRPSRRSKACGPTWSIRQSRWSTAGWRPTAKKPPERRPGSGIRGVYASAAPAGSEWVDE